MTRKPLIAMMGTVLLWGADASAEEPASPGPDASASASLSSTGLSDADLLKMGEAIEIYDERPDKPFDRDTEVRLTGEDLAARGAVARFRMVSSSNLSLRHPTKTRFTRSTKLPRTQRL
jgi:hypothetical protein